MNVTRQDAWSKEEDVVLAETVLRYIRDGKTQLEAFKEVAKQLSRTAAACGFRWNASIRKQYHEAIANAKEKRKRAHKEQALEFIRENRETENDPIQTAITLLEQMQGSESGEKEKLYDEREKLIEQLKQENEALEKQLLRYHQAWEEMGKLWHWVISERT